MQAVQWFRKSYPHVLAFHVPNGEWRHQHTADTLQRMGVLPGVADWLMFPGNAKIAIELKSDIGDQSDEQKIFMKAWYAAGGTYVLSNSIEGFKNTCLLYCGEPAPDLAPPPHVETQAHQMLPKMPWET